MNYPIIPFQEAQALSLEKFKEMDYFAVNNYYIPIELMMENAGLQLANLIAVSAKKNQSIKIGVGNGNNGGGGLVAARRLSAWGYSVYLDVFTEITQELPAKQLERALKFGTKIEKKTNPDIWVDAYLGFSQRLPLRQNILDIIKEANKSKALKISLDIPTGFLGDIKSTYFKADKIITLAASKEILSTLLSNTDIFIADLGIPKEVYTQFGIEIPPFHRSNIIQLN